MKFLVVILVVLVVGWLATRGRSRPAARTRASGRAHAVDIVACRHCGVHVPRSEAVEDATGVYCNESHRLAGPPPPR